MAAYGLNWQNWQAWTMGVASALAATLPDSAD